MSGGERYPSSAAAAELTSCPLLGLTNTYPFTPFTSCRAPFCRAPLLSAPTDPDTGAGPSRPMPENRCK